MGTVIAERIDVLYERGFVVATLILWGPQISNHESHVFILQLTDISTSDHRFTVFGMTYIQINNVRIRPPCAGHPTSISPVVTWNVEGKYASR